MTPTEPEYRLEDYVDDGIESLRVYVRMPEVKSMADIALDVDEQELKLSEKKMRYALEVKLPKTVAPPATKATFRKKKRELVVTMPCKSALVLEEKASDLPAAPAASQAIPPPGMLVHKDSMEDIASLNELAGDDAAMHADAELERKMDSSLPAGLDFDSDENAVQVADGLKMEGNKFLAQGRFEEAVHKYSQAIDIRPTAIYFANRASAYLKLEMYKFAIDDADAAIDMDPVYVKGYYRRGSAHLAMNMAELALPDFQEALRLVPSSREAKQNLKACQELLKRRSVTSASGAGAAEGMGAPTAGLQDPDLMVDESYTGPRIPEDMELPTAEFAAELMDHLRDTQLLHKRYVVKILRAVRNQLATVPTLMDVSLPDKPDAEITVCGDTHGQFYDLLNIFELNGVPSVDNPYVFNGDFVDRGSFSFETAITLLTYRLVHPEGLYLTRGNHESRTCNAMYGFEGEVGAKYDASVMSLFTEVFNNLPLATCIEKQVFVVHGGLFDRDGVTLDDIRDIDRHCEPPIEGLMCDMLWSDPMFLLGRAPSKRGVSCMFGPDVTQNFLEENGLKLLVRSHEVKPEGYEIMHDGKCITVFSAPNYCDQMGNKGAFIRFGKDMEPKFTSFEAVPHPDIPPMAYQMPGLFGL